MRKELDKFVIRMPEGMRDKLKERAKDNNRSTNQEIVDILEKGLDNTVSNNFEGLVLEKLDAINKALK